MGLEIHKIGCEWGPRGSPRAHTQGKRSHALGQAYKTPPGPSRVHFQPKQDPDTKI